jgi:uncharacterized protein HemY
MENFGRNLIIGGIVLILVGAGLYIATKFGLPLGRQPGDIRIERDGGGFHFPIATSIILSVIVTLVLNVIIQILRK